MPLEEEPRAKEVIHGKWFACLRPIITPMVTLVIVMGAYTVIPIVGSSLVTKMGTGVYNWIFIVGIAGAAMWLTLAWLVQSGTIIHSLEGARKGGLSLLDSSHPVLEESPRRLSLAHAD